MIGLGYVGLPLAMEMGKAGFSVIGIDVDREKVNKINSKNSYIPNVDEGKLTRAVFDKKLTTNLCRMPHSLWVERMSLFGQFSCIFLENYEEKQVRSRGNCSLE